MKTYYIYLAILALSITSCNSTKWASTDSYSDDLYFNANDKPSTVSNNYIPAFSDKQIKKENRKEVNSMYGSYQRENPNYSMEQVTSDFSDIQNSYTQLLSNDSISDIDTVFYYNDETGYWVDGFDGSAMDLDYATRMIRFHGPFTGIPYWSPLYTDVVYSNSWDWNIYVDGNYAYAFPTYSNPYYWNSGYRYGHSRMNFNMSFGWGGYYGYGWGYPGYGWGGYPGYGWGYPGYGWGYPGYGCGYPGYGPGYPVHPGYPSDENYYYGSRVTNPTTGRMNAKDEYVRNPRSANATMLKSASSTRTTKSISSDNNMVINRGDKTYTRVSRNNQAQPNGDKKSVSNSRNGNSTNGSVNVRTTRKSYSSYSKSTSTKRPTFNRPTTSRSSTSTVNSNSSSGTRSRTIYSAPRRSSSSSSRSSQTRSSSNSTYRKGSSKSSSYSPSRSSSTKSSYSSTPSSSSRSSGSSYSSSGSSSRSSGSSSSRSSGSSRSTRGSR